MAAQLTDQELTSCRQLLPATGAQSGAAQIAWNDLNPNSDCESGTDAALALETNQNNPQLDATGGAQSGGGGEVRLPGPAGANRPLDTGL